MAYDFSGTDQHVDVTVPAIDSGDWTAIGWATFDSIDNQQVFSCFKPSGSLDIQFMYLDTGGQLGHMIGYQNYQNFGAPAIAIDTLALTTGVWYDIAVVFTASDNTVRMYRGDDAGTSMAETGYGTNTSGGPTGRETGATTFRFGEDAFGGSDFNGRLEHWQWFSRALILTEMESHRTGTSPSLTSCVFWLPFTGGSPLDDLSGNSRNGTATGATHTTDVHTLSAPATAKAPHITTKGISAARRALLVR